MEIFTGVQDNSFPPVAAGGTGPELVLDGLEAVPEHPDIHGVLGGLVLSLVWRLVTQSRTLSGCRVR